MKIEILLYDENNNVKGKAIETNCQSAIINGVHVISQGGINAEISDLLGQATPDNLGMTLVPPLDS
jgi:hypothetical protein